MIMPTISFLKRYNAFYKSAVKVFTSTDLTRYRLTKRQGSSLYRYVSYRNSMPQAADAGKTLWLSLEDDKSNRWTGWGQTANDSSQGLYFSNEFLAEGQPFPELDHYQDKAADPDAMIAYFEYSKGIEPKLMTAKASELRSMFLFTMNKELSGLDLKLYTLDEQEQKQNNPLLEKILQKALEEDSMLLEHGESLDSLYTDPKNADFCRAIGNACFNSVEGIDCFETSSVRDLKSVNSVLKAAPREPLGFLAPEGRATFFVNESKVGQGVYTISDMVYNATFEGVNTVQPFDLPTKQQFRNTLAEVGNKICDDMIREYEELLKQAPPNEVMQQVGKQIWDVRTYLKDGNYQQALTSIDQVQTSIKNIDLKKDLKANQVQALKMSDSVMRSLSEMATSIELADKEIKTRQDVEPGKIDISDPDLEVLDPAKKFADVIP
jgi:hypothetical protein